MRSQVLSVVYFDQRTGALHAVYCYLFGCLTSFFCSKWKKEEGRKRKKMQKKEKGVLQCLGVSLKRWLTTGEK